MTISGHRPYYRGSSCVCANCGQFLFDVRTGARLRALKDVDPVKVAAVERRFSSDPKLAKRLASEDLYTVISTYKLADKFNDFLMNPKARPDLQTPEAQDFLGRLQGGYLNNKTDALMPWLTREWKKGRIQHTPSNSLKFEGHPDYEYDDIDGTQSKFHNLTPAELNHWADWYGSDHPSRQGKDIMQMKSPELHKTVKDWDADMRDQAEGPAQIRGNIVHSYPDGWTVQQLTKAKELEDEGEAMGHCVGSYARPVMNGQTLIYSLRDHQNEPHATWEITPKWHKGMVENDEDSAFVGTPDGQLYPKPENDIRNERGFWTEPVPEGGTMEQIQGKGNKPPIPEYQKRIKDYFEKTMPDLKDRPTWEPQHYDDPEYLLDPDDGGYVAYHPGEYGLAKPETTYDWPSIVNGALSDAGGYNESPASDLTQKAVEHGQFEPFAHEAGNQIELGRQQHQEEMDNAFDHWWDQQGGPLAYDDYYPHEEDFNDPETGIFNEKAHGEAMEEYEKREQEIYDHAYRDYMNENNPQTDMHNYMDELEVEIAAQKRREQQAQGQDGENALDNVPTQNLPPTTGSTKRPSHQNFSTGLPCRCTFAAHLGITPRTSKTRSLYHGTLIDHLPSIQSEGLRPQVGPFVEDAYRDEYDRLEEEEGRTPTGELFRQNFDPVVHATNSKELARALNAIRAQVGYKLNKQFGEVNREDVQNHGVLLKIPGAEGSPKEPQEAGGWNYNEDEYTSHPQSVEPEDYYTHESVLPHALVPITGPAMMRVFDRANLRMETPEGRPRTPEWQERTAAPTRMPICEVCGDLLEHGKCKRCDWSTGPSNAMGDGDQNPADPTKEMRPAIQASSQPPPPA